MGRGRQKAKATKQARDMKYYSPQTDYSALERELRRESTSASDSSAAESADSEYIDRHANRGREGGAIRR